MKAQAKARAKQDAQARAGNDAAAAAKAKADDRLQQDMPAFRSALARRIHVIIGTQQGYWRQCPERSCRRARSCRVPKAHCGGAPAMPQPTPEEAARALADFRTSLEAARRADRSGSREP
ncbi:MAG: hypothetical protein GC182_12660 [Rhodopseudomonas sp.]|nr:hypothetical protein [Rhodopseudomonas sp.]